ncbi:CACO2 protein, partial [Bucorvus abyssinicus]|nr:CACO2 protein [Bucorvus abyssinicus]
MGETSDKPPSSAVLIDSFHFSQVIFNNVNKFYDLRGDITCYYTLTQNMVPRKKDWVGIFRVGWKTIREYYTFSWAPLPSDDHSDTSVQQQIQFKSYYLPKDDEYYQFCYIDQAGMVRGASVPFQFIAETKDDILVVRTQGEEEEIELQNKKLREENEELKANSAHLQQQINYLQEELKKTQGLQNSLECLKSNTEKLEQEVNSLKENKKHLEELDESRGAELHQLRKQIQHMTLEKELLETRLKSTRDRVDQLQSQVSNYEKEVANLSQADHDKTELESLKEENCQLRVSRTRQHQCWELSSFCLPVSRDLPNNTLPSQQQNRNLTKECEKQKRSAEILQARKDEADKENQKLRDENDRHLKALSQTRSLSSFSFVSQAGARIPAPKVGGLVYGNPYCGEITWHSLRNHKYMAASVRERPLCGDVFTEDVDPSQYEARVQSHLLQCPFCSETFEKSNKQVFAGHILCHDRK